MPRREDERERPSSLRYCVFCQRYMSVSEWDTHPHNPDMGKRGRARLRRVLIIIAIVAAVALLVWLLGDVGSPA